VTDSNGGKDDEIAGQSVSDIETFWESVYSDTFKGQFTPVKGSTRGTPMTTTAASAAIPPTD
jgi:hypothetical protein